MDRPSNEPQPVPNALTIDVEDYFHVENVKSLVAFKDWPTYQLRVAANVERLLAVFHEYETRSTFFVLGWVAEQLPRLVRQIHEEGHEIACHGYSHEMITGQTPDEFRLDVRKAKEILESIIGEPVIGYRAPTFSITRNTIWALDVLAEEGFLYDSSIFPVRHDRYGIADWSRFLQKVNLRNEARIVEAPPLTLRILGLNAPLAGGGYFRLAPLWLTRLAVRRMNRSGHPAIMYLHPWEIDADQPRFALPPLRKFRHYVNLDTTESKLRALLTEASFVEVRSLLALRGLLD